MCDRGNSPRASVHEKDEQLKSGHVVSIAEPDCSGLPDTSAGYVCRDNMVYVSDDSSGGMGATCRLSPLTAVADPWVGPAAIDCPESSSGSLHISPSSLSPSRKKKGVGVAGRSIEEEVCLICGDRASGYHYNALSCEGCKGFFRRSITRNAVYTCKYGGHCEMDMWMRRRCQACRLLRCREAGMKEECLLSDDQCRARDVRRKARQKVQRAQPDTQSSPSGAGDPSAGAASSSGASVKLEESETADDEIDNVVANPLERLSDEFRELVETIVILQDEYELPSDSDLEHISNIRISDQGRPKDMPEVIYKHMAEMTVLVTKLVVEFAKRLPRFSSIPRLDQIVLLKGSAGEVMMLRAARRYDITTDTIVFANGIPFSRSNLYDAGLKDYADGMFKFCHGMGKIGVDNAEFALLTAICIFSERPEMEALTAKHVELIQEWYVACLRAYESHRRPRNSNFLAKLLMKLTELRTLSIEHSDMLFSLKVQKGSLPPLLHEYFSVADD